MGTGKSTVGRLLSKELGLKLLDLDEMIEKEAAMEIKDIFRVYGEARFRKLEADVIRKLSEGAFGQGIVISTGGGAVVNRENRALLKSFGIVVCLKASVDEILRRVGDKDDRPLLAAPDRKEAVERLLNERDEAYRDCDLAIDTTHLKIEEAAARIREFVSAKDK